MCPSLLNFVNIFPIWCDYQHNSLKHSLHRILTRCWEPSLTPGLIIGPSSHHHRPVWSSILSTRRHQSKIRRTEMSPLRLSTEIQMHLQGCLWSSPGFVLILSCRPSSMKLSASPILLKNSEADASRMICDKEIPPHVVVQNPLARHQTRAGHLSHWFYYSIWWF